MKTLSLFLAIFLFVGIALFTIFFLEIITFISVGIFVGFLIYLLIDAIYCVILEKFEANPFVWVVDFKINK